MRKEISSGTLRNYIKTIKLFFTMNDILVNWDKIRMGMPTVNQTSDARVPEISEINALLDYNDIRIKSIVLTMLSSGIRVGAWDWLKWKHIIPIEKDGTIVAAKIIVYAGEPEQYFSFITLECYSALKNYMDFRALHGEKISGESWLIRDQWQKISKTHGHRIGLADLPKRLNAEGIRRLIYDAWKIKGVFSVHDSNTQDKNHPFKSSLPIQLLTKYFWRWVTEEEINQRLAINKRNRSGRSQVKRFNQSISNNFQINWIERLLKTGISDGRKETLRLILGPYLAKRGNYDNAADILKDWLDKCNAVKPLDNSFNPKQRIKTSLKNTKGFLKLENLRSRYPWLYNIIYE